MTFFGPYGGGKMWLKQNEWMSYAHCADDDRFTSESAEHDEELESICKGCHVKPECMQWAIADEVSSVFAAGHRFPDPSHKRGLQSLYDRFRDELPNALEQRGDV